jgi:hypothetical protein
MSDLEDLDDITHVVLRKELRHGVLLTLEVPVETNQHRWLEAMSDLRILINDPGQIDDLRTTIVTSFLEQQDS